MPVISSTGLSTALINKQQIKPSVQNMQVSNDAVVGWQQKFAGENERIKHFILLTEHNRF